MKQKSVNPVRCLAMGALLAGVGAPYAAGTLAPDTEQLEAAFRTCVGLYEQPLPGALMRAIFDSATRDAFKADYSAAVQSFSIEREHGYSTATARLHDGVTVAGVPVRAIYASTCELECPLAVWGLELGALKADQQHALQAWVEAAPSTSTRTHGEIKVQLNTTSDGQSLLICDVSG